MKGSFPPKIFKATYMLLKKYHRTHGLSVIGWAKQPGGCYFTFFTQAAPETVHATGGQYGALTIYQNEARIPEWDGDGSFVRDISSPQVRTEELLGWYESKLDLTGLYRQNEQAIQAWRKRYTVHQSEAYLISWKVLGQLAAKAQSPVIAYRCHEYYGGIDPEDFEERCARRLGVEDKHLDSLHFCAGVAVAADGRAIDHHDNLIDLFEQHTAGKSTDYLVQTLLMAQKTDNQ